MCVQLPGDLQREGARPSEEEVHSDLQPESQGAPEGRAVCGRSDGFNQITFGTICAIIYFVVTRSVLMCKSKNLRACFVFTGGGNSQKSVLIVHSGLVRGR